MKKKKHLLIIFLLSLFLLIPFLTNNYKAETIKERVSEKIKIKVTPITYFTETSSLGPNYRNYLQSVYFFVDEKYNDSLITEITANWDYYQIEKVLLHNQEKYKDADFFLFTTKDKTYGFKTKEEVDNYFSNLGYEVKETHLTDTYYRVKYKYPGIGTTTEYFYFSRVSFLYYKNINDINLKPEDIFKIKYLNESLINHKAHYNTPIRNEEDNGINLKSFDDNHNWFQKFINYGFNMPIYEENYTQHKLIEVVTEDKLQGSDLEVSKRLGIQKSQLNKFKEDFRNNKNKRCYIFRFGTGTVKVEKLVYNSSGGLGGIQTEYYSGYKNNQRIKGDFVNEHARYITTDIYKNFEIIELEMSKLINKEIPEENIPDPNNPGSNIPNVENPNHHQVEQENGPIDITPGIKKPTDKLSFLGVNWKNIQDKFKNFFNKQKKTLQYILYSILTLFGLYILSLLIKILKPIFSLFKRRK